MSIATSEQLKAAWYTGSLEHTGALGGEFSWVDAMSPDALIVVLPFARRAADPETNSRQVGLIWAGISEAHAAGAGVLADWLVEL